MAELPLVVFELSYPGVSMRIEEGISKKEMLQGRWKTSEIE